MALGQNSYFPAAHMIQFPEMKKMLVYACHVDMLARSSIQLSYVAKTHYIPRYPKCVHNPD